MKMDLVIREALEDDLETVVDLWEELLEYHRTIDSSYWAPARDARETMLQWWRQAPEDADRLLLVAEVQGEVVGFVHGTLANTPPPIEDRPFVGISDIAVRADRRRRGIGRALIDALSEGFAEREPQELRLSVALRNDAAVAFYGELGFEPVTYGMRRALG